MKQFRVLFVDDDKTTPTSACAGDTIWINREWYDLLTPEFQAFIIWHQFAHLEEMERRGGKS